ncbi:MAG: PEP-CTERM sorting domain-containing protein [Chthoniobacteraceae bacterium]
MRTVLFTFISIAVLSASALATDFTPGDIVVDRVGTGTVLTTNVSAAVFLDEYSTSGGSPVASFALPTAANGSENPYTQDGTASSEGQLTLSPNGEFLTLFGYDAAPGVASISSSDIPRTVAIIDASGDIDTTTALSDAAQGNNPRSAITTDGNSIWVAGATGGIRYTTDGSTTSTELNSTDTNFEELQIADGQLYASSQSASTEGVFTIGTGLPATAGQTITLLPGLTVASPTNLYSFFLADIDSSSPNTLYIADTSTSKAIQKFSLVSGSWVAEGDISISGNVTGITGEVDGDDVDIFTTSPTKLYSLTDTSGADATINGTPTTLATAAANESFLGVSFAPVAAAVPEPNSLAALGLGAVLLIAGSRRIRRGS